MEAILLIQEGASSMVSLELGSAAANTILVRTGPDAHASHWL